MPTCLLFGRKSQPIFARRHLKSSQDSGSAGSARVYLAVAENETALPAAANNTAKRSRLAKTECTLILKYSFAPLDNLATAVYIFV